MHATRYTVRRTSLSRQQHTIIMHNNVMMVLSANCLLPRTSLLPAARGKVLSVAHKGKLKFIYSLQY